MCYEYRLSDGQYVLHDGEDPICPGLDEVSIAFDKASGTLHKHGSPALVEEWLDKARTKFRTGGCGHIADDLIMVTGRFELEDLNRCLSTTGYIGRLYQRLLNGEVNPSSST